ncbi:MAG: hypothetical protein KAS23_13760, partial [Anaerohalosphaera sp.]|nr:hypothetical protein [Anaerohalosphaera sp.]
MQEIYKNKNFYFIIIPLLAATWTVTAATLTLPTADKQYERKVADWTEAKGHIINMLALDLGRLKYKDSNPKNSGEFDYATVIDQFSGENGIPASGYSLRAGTIIKKGTKKTKTADMTIDKIEIVDFTKFISSLLNRWPSLQIDTLKLASLKDGPDAWKATLKFT